MDITPRRAREDQLSFLYSRFSLTSAVRARIEELGPARRIFRTRDPVRENHPRSMRDGESSEEEPEKKEEVSKPSGF
jgi:hypothetical protein